MLTEHEAREILRAIPMERDITERLTCCELVEKYGLIPVAVSTSVEPVISETARRQTENMTLNVRPENPPYFVR